MHISTIIKSNTFKILSYSLVVSVLFSTCAIKRNKPVEKLRICPEEWYINRMPMTNYDNKADEYFILNGERRELTEFDTDWIKKNCSLKKPTEVF